MSAEVAKESIRLRRALGHYLIRASDRISEQIAAAEAEEDGEAIDRLAATLLDIWKTRWELGLLPDHATFEDGDDESANMRRAVRAHEDRIIEAVTPDLKEAIETLSQAMATLSNTDDERGALLALLQGVNTNLWAVHGELAIDVPRTKPVTPLPNIGEVKP